MALGTILSARPAAFYNRLYMASVAAKRSHLIIPTTLASSRRMYYVNRQLSDLQSQVDSMKAEIASLRKDKQVLLHKHKDPFLKDIELEISKFLSSQQAWKLPPNFRIVDECSDSVTLETKTHIPKEVIRLYISQPRSSGVPLRITVGSEGIFDSKLQFYCTIRADCYIINEIEADLIFANKKMPYVLMPENVKYRFRNYLGLRGVSSITTGIIHGYMLQKQQEGFYQSFKEIAEAEA